MASREGVDIIHPMYGWNMSSLEEETNRFSNVAIVEIKNNQSTMQYDGEGIDILITHYKLKVITDLKDNFDSNVFYVSYYGGVAVQFI